MKERLTLTRAKRGDGGGAEREFTRSRAFQDVSAGGSVEGQRVTECAGWLATILSFLLFSSILFIFRDSFAQTPPSPHKTKQLKKIFILCLSAAVSNDAAWFMVLLYIFQLQPPPEDIPHSCFEASKEHSCISPVSVLPATVNVVPGVCGLSEAVNKGCVESLWRQPSRGDVTTRACAVHQQLSCSPRGNSKRSWSIWGQAVNHCQQGRCTESTKSDALWCMMPPLPKSVTLRLTHYRNNKKKSQEWLQETLRGIRLPDWQNVKDVTLVRSFLSPCCAVCYQTHRASTTLWRNKLSCQRSLQISFKQHKRTVCSTSLQPALFFYFLQNFLFFKAQAVRCGSVWILFAFPQQACPLLVGGVQGCH